ncbi:hypothetical protein J6590_107843, partial [Homalodisca vitripennis]
QESSSNSSRDGEGGVPHPQWTTPPQYVALRAHITRGPAPGADDKQTRHEHDVTRSGQRIFRDTLDNPFGYPDSVLGNNFVICSECVNFFTFTMRERALICPEAR